MSNRPLRLAAFGLRNFPPNDGSAGEDKFAFELYPRLAKYGLNIHVFTRTYNCFKIRNRNQVQNVNILPVWTLKRSGFDTLLHSMFCTLYIILNDIADVVHIHNGGNSIWAFLLRIFGKKVFVTQDGIDWKRDKWPWYAKIFLKTSAVFTAYLPNGVIFDNVYVQKIFENKYNRCFDMIEYGSSVDLSYKKSQILQKFSLTSQNYILFVGRFIPDKGIHYLIEAYKRIKTEKKLVLIGGSPNNDPFENHLKRLAEIDERIIFPGYIYGGDINKLIKEAYLYVQPSDVEGLSPVILQVMGLRTPLLCSDIDENQFIVKNDALLFEKSNVSSLETQLHNALEHPQSIKESAQRGQHRISSTYDWDKVTRKYLAVFNSA
jgi:glycosyltransferase involved in cell wall biosynthesis